MGISCKEEAPAKNKLTHSGETFFSKHGNSCRKTIVKSMCSSRTVQSHREINNFAKSVEAILETNMVFEHR